jgi:hypothetical protein
MQRRKILSLITTRCAGWVTGPGESIPGAVRIAAPRTRSRPAPPGPRRRHRHLEILVTDEAGNERSSTPRRSSPIKELIRKTLDRPNGPFRCCSARQAQDRRSTGLIANTPIRMPTGSSWSRTLATGRRRHGRWPDLLRLDHPQRPNPRPRPRHRRLNASSRSR